jgi:hypothetical protein
MTGLDTPPSHGVPTLTEVVEWPDAARVARAAPRAATAAGSPLGTVPALEAPDALVAALPSDELVTQRVLIDLQRQVDLMLEYRLREVLTPLLARATDSVIRDARSELASTLRDIVARAVAQEMARHRIR